MNHPVKIFVSWVFSVYFLLTLFACGESKEGDIQPIPEEPGGKIYRIPVVVHILHKGEPLGEGYNLSDDRIRQQIKSLNDDFRRKEGTRGFNVHPDGADTQIEFVLADVDPAGNPTDGIVRIDYTRVENPTPPNAFFDFYAYYSYWDYKRYLNIWVEPLPEAAIDIVLGKATGPQKGLPGNHLLLRGEPEQAEGILINSFHFGASAIDSDYNLGRSLTHEVGHYLGLLHTWGDGNCETNDYCKDTPPVERHHAGCPAEIPLACDGQDVMVENYMDYTADRCMNIFTADQVERMHYVLENSPERMSLLDSPGLP